jgi:hypothetical protein
MFGLTLAAHGQFSKIRESGCLSMISFKQFEAYRRDARKSNGPAAAGAVEQARMPAAACRAHSSPLRVK